MTNEELLSKTISYLRFPLTVGVVFIHFDLSQGLDIGGMTHGLNNPEWYFFIINLISGTLASIGVPLFFIISGFLFFYHNDFNRDIYKQKLLSRSKTLLVPYILWNLIAILWQFKCFLPGVSSFYPPVEFQLTPMRILNSFFYSRNGIFVCTQTAEIAGGGPILPIDGPMWYVRDLIVMVMLSPVIHWLTKKIGYWFVTTNGLVWFLSQLILSKESPIEVYLSMVLTASFFFAWGAFYSISNENFVMRFRQMKYAPYIYVILAIIDVLTKDMFYNSYIHKAGILLGIVSVVLITSKLLENNKIKVHKTLANSSFFIFALHYMIINNIGKMTFILLHIPDNNPFAMLSLYLGTTIVTILFCLCLYLLLRRYTPRICSILTGGR